MKKPIGMCSLTYPGKLPFFVGFNVSNTSFTNYWILDYGATNHMTPFPNFFSTCFSCPSNKRISTIDGNMINPMGQGDIQVNLTIP